ncbi:holin-like protein [Azotobacter vinelandii CA]|uniref:Holin-like protein n=2 Tax=Azotobacter vinelandii TaxID=354 RepID=C1DS24_AZOVD|nr:phage holin, lambda family [Azotobacter vinelandii]ACO79899.1 holin-like protein [Azotobacter vinelandii DJ]AGK16167.1 holin-like protein [Azotobacter vinelandii CA]AGK21582.1 holin-like protein [Azotobacter vinelandii CA6]
MNRMKHMPDKPETWAWLAAWVQSNWPGIYAGVLAFVIAVFRIAYTGGRLRQLVLEAPLCGFIGLGVSYSTELLGVSPSAGAFFGSMVGLIGVETVRATARRLLEKKVEQA